MATPAPAAMETVDAPVPLLDQVLTRLQEKRVSVEKVVLQFGEAPAGIKEVFELCRGFERAYTTLINESAVARDIKEAFSGEKGLAGAVKKLPFDKIFKLENVKAICKTADGYQPSLVSPEKGMRSLASDSLDQVTEPVHQCVAKVYQLLLNAAKDAAENAGKHTESALVGASMPMYVPDFKTVVMPAVVAALDDWKVEAIKMALMLVDMERSYITAGFFRYTQHHRYQKLKQQEAMRLAMQNKPTGVKGVAQKASAFFPTFGGKHEHAPSPASEFSAPAAQPPPQPQQQQQQPQQGNAPPSPPPPAGAQPQQGGPEASADSDISGTPPARSTVSAPAAASTFNPNADPEDFIAAYFEKYTSDDLSKTSPPDWKFQRRFFVLAENQRVLYYFKSPEDVQKNNGLRGQVNIAECVVEDLDERGIPRGPQSRGVDPNDKAQFMIRIRAKPGMGSVVKDHSVLVLRAENYAIKSEWLVRLRKVTEPPKRAAPAPPGPDGKPAPVGPAPTGPIDYDDLSWAKDAELTLDNHLGEGSRAFRSENVRDPDGRLLPSPQQLINPLRMQERLRIKGGDPFQLRYEALLDQYSNDLNLYMSCVCDTIVITVPKAIVHCMIRKSEKNLLERLFTVIHHLTPQQMENLLREEPEIIAKRSAARKALEEVKTAIFQVSSILERQNMATAGDKKERVPVAASVFAYAGLAEFLTKDIKAAFDQIFSDTNIPEAIRFGWRPLLAPREPAPQKAPRQPPPQGEDGQPALERQSQAPGGGPRGLPQSASMRVPSSAPMRPPPPGALGVAPSGPSEIRRAPPSIPPGGGPPMRRAPPAPPPSQR